MPSSLEDVIVGTDSVREIRSVGIVGAGTMGSGIALAMLESDLSVVVIETEQSQLDRGRSLIERGIDRTAKRSGLVQQQVEDLQARVTYSLDFAALGAVDLAIEAVFEDMAIKREVFGRLDKVTKPGAILASNTSFLDIDVIATATGRSADVIGLHFFSPANIMRLLEVVRGAKTAPEVVATAFAFAHRIGKVPVLSGVCDGFIANRMMLPRALQAETLALQGTPVADIDGVLRDHGFPMGHFQMLDMAGLDVVTRGRTERSLMGDLVALGRLGQKSGGGFYDYDADRKPIPSAIVNEAIAVFAAHCGIAASPARDAAEILDRLLLPVVNEAARILDEGIAQSPADIDVAATLGYGWPVAHGGPIQWAQARGLDQVVDRLRTLHARCGSDFAPSPGLVAAARRGSF
ncbi:MAG: 3-hydroxyacyl-CoA dehydrogenase NAD-binding domain-containing protein [Novosphingobium sp.]